ncbi:hypothetical protein D3C77_740670 [compost metagenome]
MCSSINKLLASDMGDDFEPVAVTHNGGETRVVSSSGAGTLGAINIKTTKAFGAERDIFGGRGESLFGTQYGDASL